MNKAAVRRSYAFLVWLISTTGLTTLALAQSIPGAATKLGAVGIGPERCIAAGQILPYLIQVENQANATTAAQSVVVTDPLDTSKLDVTTFSLGPIKFGRRANGHPWTVDPGTGLSSYTTDLDLRPERDLIVRVYASLDPATGVAGWNLTAIDPQTGKPPADPQVGFLPPNQTDPEGAVRILFTVHPRAGLADGTVIRNRATINFDQTTTVQTPEWSNRLDTMPPESQVLPLMANQDSASFTVRWEATASASDLRDFSVYVSIDGAGFQPWRLFTTATADTFMSPGGHTYSFYSLARDSCGNLEAAPASPDAETYSRADVGPVVRVALRLDGALPNPNSGRALVWFSLMNLEPATLEVMDIGGRRLLRRSVGHWGAGRHSIDLSEALSAAGLYLLRLEQGGSTYTRRVTVVR